MAAAGQRGRSRAPAARSPPQVPTGGRGAPQRPPAVPSWPARTLAPLNPPVLRRCVGPARRQGPLAGRGAAALRRPLRLDPPASLSPTRQPAAWRTRRARPIRCLRARSPDLCLTRRSCCGSWRGCGRRWRRCGGAGASGPQGRGTGGGAPRPGRCPIGSACPHGAGPCRLRRRSTRGRRPPSSAGPLGVGPCGRTGRARRRQPPPRPLRVATGRAAPELPRLRVTRRPWAQAASWAPRAAGPAASAVAVRAPARRCWRASGGGGARPPRGRGSRRTWRRRWGRAVQCWETW
jgi:hypothetical protein